VNFSHLILYYYYFSTRWTMCRLFANEPLWNTEVPTFSWEFCELFLKKHFLQRNSAKSVYL